MPPNPQIDLDDKLQDLLPRADVALARLDGLGQVLPSVNLFIAMYVKKEALLSSPIEGTQASLKNLFAAELADTPENINAQVLRGVGILTDC